MALGAAEKAALEAALASGALTVEQDGRRVTYRSVDELKAALAYVNASIDAAAGTLRAPLYVSSTKGVAA